MQTSVALHTRELQISSSICISYLWNHQHHALLTVAGHLLQASLPKPWVRLDLALQILVLVVLKTALLGDKRLKTALLRDKRLKTALLGDKRLQSQQSRNPVLTAGQLSSGLCCHIFYLGGNWHAGTAYQWLLEAAQIDC